MANPSVLVLLLAVVLSGCGRQDLADPAATIPEEASDRRGAKGDQGERGPKGERGEAGRDGIDGANGTDGVTGPAGRDGVDGANGIDGQDGSDGANGIDGVSGADGAPGSDGTDGTNGSAGTNGQDGIDGADGEDGEDGEDGTDAMSVRVVNNTTDEEIGRLVFMSSAADAVISSGSWRFTLATGSGKMTTTVLYYAGSNCAGEARVNSGGNLDVNNAWRNPLDTNGVIKAEDQVQTVAWSYQSSASTSGSCANASNSLAASRSVATATPAFAYPLGFSNVKFEN